MRIISDQDKEREIYVDKRGREVQNWRQYNELYRTISCPLVSLQILQSPPLYNSNCQCPQIIFLFCLGFPIVCLQKNF